MTEKESEIPVSRRQLIRLKRAHDSLTTDKESHLHQFKPIPNPSGNRAERRAAQKKRKKNGRT